MYGVDDLVYVYVLMMKLKCLCGFFFISVGGDGVEFFRVNYDDGCVWVVGGLFDVVGV